MEYEVLVVADDELPAGMERVIVERTGGLPALLLLTEAAAGTWRMMNAWQDSRRESAKVFELRAV